MGLSVFFRIFFCLVCAVFVQLSKQIACWLLAIMLGSVKVLLLFSNEFTRQQQTVLPAWVLNVEVVLRNYSLVNLLEKTRLRFPLRC